jgi:hypothetical protein
MTSAKFQGCTGLAEVPELDQLLNDVCCESSDFEGERQMLRDMLRDALECWTGAGGCDRRKRALLYRKADFWIFGRYNNQPYFSFAQTCNYLGINPDFVKRLLRDWRDKSARRAIDTCPDGASRRTT